MKRINVLKVEKNKLYIPKEDFIIKGIDSKGREYTQQNPKLDCVRLWLDGEFPIDIKNERVKFIFRSESSGIEYKCTILDEGVCDGRYYIACIFWDYILEDSYLPELEHSCKIFEEVLGIFDVEIGFTTEMLKNGEILKKYIGDFWPSCHDATVDIIELNPKKLILRFYDALPKNYELDLIIKNIISGTFSEKGFGFWTDGIIMDVDILRKGQVMEVKISEYCSFENEGNEEVVYSDTIILCDELEINIGKSHRK